MAKQIDTQQQLDKSVSKGTAYILNLRSKQTRFSLPGDKHYTFNSAADFFQQLGQGTLDILRKEGKLFVEELVQDVRDNELYKQVMRAKDLFESKFGIEAFLHDTFDDSKLTSEANDLIQKQLSKAKELAPAAISAGLAYQEAKKKEKAAQKALAEVEGVKDVIVVVPDSTERAIFDYYNGGFVSNTTAGDDGLLPPIINGLDYFNTKFVGSVNEAYAEAESRGEFVLNGPERDVLGLPQIKLKAADGEDSDAPLFESEVVLPDMLVYNHNVSNDPNSVLGYTVPFRSLGFNTFAEYLEAEAEKRAAAMSERMANKSVEPPFANNNSVKYFNDAVEALAKSMPDFAANMFDVLVSTYKRVPIFNYEDIWQKEEGIFVHDSDPSEGDILHLPVNYDEFVNYHNFVFRIASITVPQSSVQTDTVSFLNRKIPITTAKTSFKNQSSLSFRADQALFFTDEIQRMSGNFVYNVAVESGDTSAIEYGANKALYGAFYMPFGPAYHLDEDNNNKINIYVPMYDSSLDTKYRHSMFDPYLMPNVKDYYANTMKLTKIPVYCFEDVRFLGNSDIPLNSQSAGIINITVNFIYRRLYKFYTDFRAPGEESSSASAE